MRTGPLRCLERRLAVVWGANTDVGKTLVSIGLLARGGGSSKYIKPIQTGEIKDEVTVARYTTLSTSDTLFQFSRPLSPDLAAALDGAAGCVSDESLLSSLMLALESHAHLTLVETAGGVLSPAPSGTPQADVFRPLRLPSLLVGDTRLGGISATSCALESLLLRGYDVPVVIMPRLPGIEADLAEHNAEAVRQAIKGYGMSSSTRVVSITKAPPGPSEGTGSENDLLPWLEETKSEFIDVHAQWSRWAEQRNSDLCWSASRATESLWWPFTQHSSIGPVDVTVVDSAYKDYLSVYKAADPKSETASHIQEQFDAVGGWWTNAAVRGTPSAALAAGRAVGRYGHVLFPEIAHEPALTLAEKLLKGPGQSWASRVFYSDDGSTGIEIALKMAFRYFTKKASTRLDNSHVSVLSLVGSYHGDTLAAMDCCPPSTFNSGQIPWYKPRGLFLNPPSARLEKGIWTVSGSLGDQTYQSLEAVLDCQTRQLRDPLWQKYVSDVHQKLDAFEASNCPVGAAILEPVMQASSGMCLVDPLFQRAVVVVSKEREIPVIYDEVFTGFWRLGVESARDILGVDPDIAVYAKLLTGATTSLAATLASRPVFESFLGASKSEALLHGHSYTGNPVGCSMALETLRVFEQAGPKQLAYKRWSNETILKLSFLNCVRGVAPLGTVLAVELNDTSDPSRDNYGSNVGARSIAMNMRRRNIYARPLGNVVYVMVSPSAEAAETRKLGAALLEELTEFDHTNCI